MSVSVPIPYSEGLISNLAVSLAPYDQAQEGGLNVFPETVLANTEISVYKQLNPFRKTLTLLNTGSIPLSMVITNLQNIENLIPLPVGGGYSFVQVIRGHLEQCINGISVVQYLTTCEYQGIIKIKNNTGTNGTILVIEGI